MFNKEKAGYGGICYPCHDTLLSKDERISKVAHCRCHVVDIWRGDKINNSSFSDLHGELPV